MHYVDRSRTEVGFTCQRKRFWNYHHAGRGVTPVTDKPDLEYGLAVHGFIESLGRGWIPNAHLGVCLDSSENVQQEWRALYQGHLYSYRHYMFPKILAEYEWIASELEIQMPLSPGITWATRLDGVLRRKSDGLYFVLEAKTSGHMDSLLKQSQHNFQLLMECEALRHWLDETRYTPGHTDNPRPVGGALLLVFDKGRKSPIKQDGQTVGYRRMSPFTYVWVHEDVGEISLDRPTKYKGWVLTPTWTIPNWLDIMAEQYPQVMRDTVQLWPGVSFDQEMVGAVKRQVLEQESRLAMPEAYHPDYELPGRVDKFWPQNFSACHNQFGRDCDYLQCCYSPTVGRDPVASELYEWRVPNHPCEVKDET